MLPINASLVLATVIFSCAASKLGWAPAITAAEIAEPRAGVCGEPATSIGCPITSA